MQRYGYLAKDHPDVGSLYSESAIGDAIKNVQKFGALPQTGILDEQTVQVSD